MEPHARPPVHLIFVSVEVGKRSSLRLELVLLLLRMLEDPAQMGSLVRMDLFAQGQPARVLMGQWLCSEMMTLFAHQV